MSCAPVTIKVILYIYVYLDCGFSDYVPCVVLYVVTGLDVKNHYYDGFYIF